MNTDFRRYAFPLLFALASCGAAGTEHAHEEEDAHAHGEEKEEQIHLLQAQLDVMGIELGSFRQLSLSTVVKANGQLEVPPQNKASVSAVMGGRVTRILVNPGDRVRRGQTLVMLEDPAYLDMQQDYATAKTEVSFLQQEYERKKLLYEDSVGSVKALQQAEAAYRTGLGKVRGLEAKLRMLQLDPAAAEAGEMRRSVPVRSPINGFVRHIDVNMGKYVQPQEELFEIIDNEHIHIDLMVYEKDLTRIREGQSVRFSLTSSPDSIFSGKIFALGKAFESEPKAMVVHAEIENKRGILLPGMYVDARVITGDETVPALPEEAVVQDGGVDYIFVKHEGYMDVDHGHSHEEDQPDDHAEDDGHSHEAAETGHEDEYIFDMVEVRTGRSDAGFVEVIPVDPLLHDVEVVVKGAFYLLAERRKGEGGHGHHH